MPHQCDLQRGIPQPHRTTHVTRRHAKCRTPRENQKTSKRAYPQPPYTRVALHRRLQPLNTEKHKVFLPNTSPMQNSCSHYTAFVFECAVLKPHTTLHDALWDVKFHTTLHDVLLCDVKFHTTLHEYIVM